jgi:hypothetical protein
MAAALAATGARADLTASYDGSLVVRRPRLAAAVAGALNQTGVAVSGTIAVDLADPAKGGVYYVSGTLRGARLVLRGTNGGGATLRWRARLKGDTALGMAAIRGRGKGLQGLLTLSRRVIAPPTSPPDTCDSSFFTGQVMGRVLQPVCAGCHVPGGSAQAANFRVTAGDPLATQQSVALNIDKAHPEESRILRKPLAQLPHAGGQQLAPGSEEHKILEQWVTLVATGQQCQGGPAVPMVPIAPGSLLLRAAMDLRGRRPAPAELGAVEADPGLYPALVDQYLHSPEFLERVKDVFDDALLVRREDFTDEARDETWAIYGEALELIAWIVANDRPFTEVGTADYTVANQLFQGDPNRMPFPMQPVIGPAWQPTRYLDGRPHAGLLSTSAFYEVWDTNNTNKNRRRANRWSIVFHCYNFLDTPVDVTRNVDNNDADAVLNAVTTRADCKACHDRLDPMASFLFPMDNVGRLEDTASDDFFSGNAERWRSANKRPPAVYGMPGTDIRDMGRLLVSHPKFAECQTRRAFRMLFLRDPKTTAELTTAADISARWPAEDGYNFRQLVKRWMLSDAYRQRPQTDGPEWVRRASPERLESLIQDLTGFVWSRDPDDDEDDADPNSDPPRTVPVPLLTTEEDGFKIILGGINGVSVSGRSYSLNASVAMVQRKVAALAAAYVLRTDLGLPDGQRRLLFGVSGTEHPTGGEAALRDRIAWLVRRLHGQRAEPGSAVVTSWWQLYRALYNDTTQSGQVPGTPGERAWRGLLTAMLRSPKILLY